MDASEEDGGGKKRGGMMVPLLLGLVLALVGGGGGYWAVTMGPLASEPPEEMADDMPDGTEMPGADVVFVPLEPVVVSLGPVSGNRHLMFTAHLEVPSAYEEEVTTLVPRILDVLNSYLRVIDIAEIGEPTSLAVLRAQVLRRMQVVSGPGRINDLLVTQFVVN